jgi:ubiquinone/menaquinone biosynthesis C-methylase UbiE
MNERWQEHFDHDVAFHRKTAAIYDHVNTEPRLLAKSCLFAPLERHVAPGESMLDLGCGTGQMLLRHAARFRTRRRCRSQRLKCSTLHGGG